MDISRNELFEHLKICPKCRQDLKDWKVTYGILRAKAYNQKPEVKIRLQELLDLSSYHIAKGGNKIIIDVKWEIGSAAGKVYKLLEANGEMPISVIIEKTGLKEYHVQQAIGWLAGQEKIIITKDDKAAYASLR